MKIAGISPYWSAVFLDSGSNHKGTEALDSDDVNLSDLSSFISSNVSVWIAPILESGSFPSFIKICILDARSIFPLFLKYSLACESIDGVVVGI